MPLARMFLTTLPLRSHHSACLWRLLTLSSAFALESPSAGPVLLSAKRCARAECATQRQLCLRARNGARLAATRPGGPSRRPSVRNPRWG